MRLLLLASEVRSGSTYIAETLAYSFAQSYGIECWGLAKEQFASIALNRNPLLLNEIFNGMYINQAGFRTSKLMVKDIVGLINIFDNDRSLYDEFFSDSCAWLIVRRRNKLRQAVSLAFAEQSGVWHHYDVDELTNDSRLTLAPSDVRPYYNSVIASDDFLDLFSEQLVRKYTVYYEDFRENPSSVAMEIINKLGIPVDPMSFIFSSPKLVPTSQLEKVELERDFRRYFLRNL